MRLPDVPLVRSFGRPCGLLGRIGGRPAMRCDRRGMTEWALTVPRRERFNTIDPNDAVEF